MITVGITGGIGSGKSTVCRVFEKLGVPVYDADSEAKKLYDTVPELTEKIIKEFSEDVLDKRGKPDRHKLASLVFADEAALKKLNKIVHPAVIRHFEEWKEQFSDQRYILKEAAILFESGTDKDCNYVVTVTAPDELRIQRILRRDKRTRQEVELIISHQLPDEEKISKSQFIVVNDEKQMIIPQVLDIHNKLLSLIKAPSAAQ